ncbi:hypothetical protein MSG28_013590 [Choristoneura fumiferana]|uniref:Uncharacterized protein n=1 Tax=Choristoneura fumiferana TaxID=7141 RepID=A0ACC0K819_CHOFU|nr:hypothetical protein MSG28_013590 [Choristoneura fumiferana]
MEKTPNKSGHATCTTITSARAAQPSSSASSSGDEFATAPDTSTESTGGVVRRMRWTHSMNVNCMRAYYGATEGETI